MVRDILAWALERVLAGLLHLPGPAEYTVRLGDAKQWEQGLRTALKRLDDIDRRTITRYDVYKNELDGLTSEINIEIQDFEDFNAVYAESLRTRLENLKGLLAEGLSARAVRTICGAATRKRLERFRTRWARAKRHQRKPTRVESEALMVLESRALTINDPPWIAGVEGGLTPPFEELFPKISGQDRWAELLRDLHRFGTNYPFVRAWLAQEEHRTSRKIGEVNRLTRLSRAIFDEPVTENKAPGVLLAPESEEAIENDPARRERLSEEFSAMQIGRASDRDRES